MGEKKAESSDLVEVSLSVVLGVAWRRNSRLRREGSSAGR